MRGFPGEGSVFGPHELDQLQFDVSDLLNYEFDGGRLVLELVYAGEDGTSQRAECCCSR